ncbi:MAG: hypothetical protein HYV09_26680 [Deltaproteobacteria bacterium]|nr:hypothetical protein [Deltaproteobacteria bacterium]
MDVHDDGSAVAWYGDAPLLWYESLEALLAAHALTTADVRRADAADIAEDLRLLRKTA